MSSHVIWTFLVIVAFLLYFWPSNKLHILFGQTYIYLGLSFCTWGFGYFGCITLRISVHYSFGLLKDLLYLSSTSIYSAGLRFHISRLSYYLQPVDSNWFSTTSEKLLSIGARFLGGFFYWNIIFRTPTSSGLHYS